MRYDECEITIHEVYSPIEIYVAYRAKAVFRTVTGIRVDPNYIYRKMYRYTGSSRNYTLIKTHAIIKATKDGIKNIDDVTLWAKVDETVKGVHTGRHTNRNRKFKVRHNRWRQL